MSGTYAGSSASYPSTVATIENGDAPTETVFQTPLTNLTDRTAYLKSHTDALESAAQKIDVQRFTSSGTWTKPAGAVWCRIVAVGGGQDGGTPGSGVGAVGGKAGGVSHWEGPASSLGASLTVHVGARGSSSGGETYVADGSVTVLYAHGANSPAPTVSDVGAYTVNGANGGAAGSAGTSSIYGRGGKPGDGGSHRGGYAGRGYGAGGGGARENAGAAANGGGGGGGFGPEAVAADGSSSTGGGSGNGAGGLVQIVTTISAV